MTRSFTLGGIGLHTGDFGKIPKYCHMYRCYSGIILLPRWPTPLPFVPFAAVIIRVRPAFANEGRYFVLVPPGTNANKFSLETPKIVSHEELDAKAGASDGLTDEYRAQLYLGFLQERERGTYTGDFSDYLSREIGEPSDTFFVDIGSIGEPEAPSLPRGTDNLWVDAALKSAESHENVMTKLVSEDRRLEVLSVEHLLAALEQCGVDNARIELEYGEDTIRMNALFGEDGELLVDNYRIEVPVGDGSALPWAIEIQKVGVQPALMKVLEDEDATKQSNKHGRPKIEVSEVVTVHEGDAFISFFPSGVPKVTAGIDYHPDTPIIGRQWFTWSPADVDSESESSSTKERGTEDERTYDGPINEEEHYRWEIAPARMVMSLSEANQLVSDGLLRGGPDFCVLVAEDNEWLDPSLERFPTEDASRNAVGKVMGNLSLLAVPGGQGLPIGHIVSYCADTELQLKFMKALYSRIS